MLLYIYCTEVKCRNLESARQQISLYANIFDPKRFHVWNWISTAPVEDWIWIFPYRWSGESDQNVTKLPETGSAQEKNYPVKKCVTTKSWILDRSDLIGVDRVVIYFLWAACGLWVVGCHVSIIFVFMFYVRCGDVRPLMTSYPSDLLYPHKAVYTLTAFSTICRSNSVAY